MELLVAFIAGLVVMDVMWAWRLGIPQAMYYRFKHRNDPKPVYTDEDNYEYDGRS
jgi:hypothetical protein